MICIRICKDGTFASSSSSSVLPVDLVLSSPILVGDPGVPGDKDGEYMESLVSPPSSIFIIPKEGIEVIVLGVFGSTCQIKFMIFGRTFFFKFFDKCFPYLNQVLKSH